MPIIILEGCDGVGKSTLAEELQRVSGYEVVQGSSFEISEMGKKGMFEHMMNLLSKKNIIIDRFYMSNFVYGNLYDYPTMDREQFLLLAKEAEKKALTVYVTATPSVIRDRIRHRGDDKVKVDEVDKILHKYTEALQSSQTYQSSVLHVNSTMTSVKNSASMILEFAELQERKIFMNHHLKK